MCRLHANITPFSIKDLSILEFWCPQTSLGSWNQSLKNQGTTVCVHVSVCTRAHGTLEGSLPHRSVGGRGRGRRGRSWLPCSTAESALRAGLALLFDVYIFIIFKSYCSLILCLQNVSCTIFLT